MPPPRAPGWPSKSFNDFLDDLAGRGCRALAYRLSGPTPLDHMCVKHLSSSLRVVVAFESPHRAWILLVGPHDDDDQIMDIYTELYRLLGVDPRDAAGRLKPPCCDETQDLPLSLEPRSPMFSIMRPRSARQDGPRKQTRPCQCAGITARKSGSLTPVR